MAGMVARALHYFRELAELLRAGGPPDQAAIARLRERYDMVQLTPLRASR